MQLRALLAVAVLLAPSAAPAQAADPHCPATDASLPAELAPWTAKAELASAAKPADLAGAVLQPGAATNATLHPTDEVAYVAPPHKPQGPASYGGLFALDIKQAGTYRVALGSGAWIDVLADAKPPTEAAFGPGPSCSTIRKTVFFALAPGRYLIQLSANAAPATAIMVVKAAPEPPAP